MATKIGKRLYAISNQENMLTLINMFHAAGYAVAMKLEEMFHNTNNGMLHDKPNTYYRIAVELHEEPLMVLSIISKMKELKYIHTKDEYIYIPSVKMMVQKNIAISEARSAIGKLGAEKKAAQATNFSDGFWDSWNDFIDIINKTFGRNYSKDPNKNKKTQKQFNARLKQGYTIQDFHKAILNVSRNQWHKENSFNYATPELFSREDKLTFWVNASSPGENKEVYKMTSNRLLGDE